jgi:hypothetical protein
VPWHWHQRHAWQPAPAAEKSIKAVKHMVQQYLKGGLEAAEI